MGNFWFKTKETVARKSTKELTLVRKNGIARIAPSAQKRLDAYKAKNADKLFGIREVQI